MNFNFFIDFLHCLYIEEVEIASRTNNIERTAIMVFSEEFTNNISDNELAEYNKRQAQRTARCVKILGKGVVKVVHRCDAAVSQGAGGLGGLVNIETVCNTRHHSEEAWQAQTSDRSSSYSSKPRQDAIILLVIFVYIYFQAWPHNVPYTLCQNYSKQSSFEGNYFFFQFLFFVFLNILRLFLAPSV